MTTAVPSLAAAEALDQQDPLASRRALFDLPADVIYLDGNSLGALPKDVAARTATVVSTEWGQSLIRGWNTHDWIGMPARVGDKIGQLIGAAPGTVVCADSTSVNLFKVLAAALALRPDRRDIISQRDNFPTDLYMAQGLISLTGGDRRLRLLDDANVIPALSEDTAVLMLTEVDYRTGAKLDMVAITQAAHDVGALVIWDLAHSAGAFPVDLTRAGADFAVGCGYKYLNGGPGAPAFLYVAPAHQDDFAQPLSGWMGHASPFTFEPDYRPAVGIDRYLCGTPSVLAMSALDVGVDIALEADMGAIRAKSIALCDFFITAVEQLAPGHGLQLVSPRDGTLRGSQVSFAHSDGYPVMQALIARGVIGDFRAPNILRFGFTPLYVGFTDTWRAAEALADILATRAWDDPAFHARKSVT